MGIVYGARAGSRACSPTALYGRLVAFNLGASSGALAPIVAHHSRTAVAYSSGLISRARRS